MIIKGKAKGLAIAILGAVIFIQTSSGVLSALLFNTKGGISKMFLDGSVAISPMSFGTGFYFIAFAVLPISLLLVWHGIRILRA